MKYTFPITSDKWILEHAKDIEMFFKFCHCTGEDCACDCPYYSVGLTDYDSTTKLNHKECTPILLKHYKRLMYLQGKTRKDINTIEQKVKESIKCCIDYYGYNASGINP